MLDTDKRPKRRFEAAEVWCIRRIMKITCREKSHTEKKWKLPDTKDPYSKPSEKRQQLFVYINRADGLEKQISSGKYRGTKSRGTQRTNCTDSLNTFVTIKESPKIEIIVETDDREYWQAMIADMSVTDLAHDDDDSK